MAKARGSRKGTPFERKMCHWLDQWWAKGMNLDPDDSYFWRTAGSGARATVRKKKGKKTASHDGDVTSVHPQSKWFSFLVTLELKKGYNKTANVHDLLDKPRRSKPSLIEIDFIGKARTAHAHTGSFAWMVIHQRDRRRPMCYMPHRLLKAFVNQGCFKGLPNTYGEISCIVRGKTSKEKEVICIVPLSYFLNHVTPSSVKALAKKWKRGEKII